MVRITITDRAREAINLPELRGTPKQIEWAQSIRGRFAYMGTCDLFTSVGRVVDRNPARFPADWTERLADMLVPIFANPDAKWWIEHRYDLPRFWIGWTDSADMAEMVFGAAMRGGN